MKTKKTTVYGLILACGLFGVGLLVSQTNHFSLIRGGIGEGETYKVEYSSSHQNYPTEVGGNLEATDRYTTVRFKNFLAGTDGTTGLVYATEAGDHSFYNVTPVHGVNSISIKANSSAKDSLFACSYNSLTLEDVKGNNRPDLFIIDNIDTSEKKVIDAADVPQLGNCRYFLFYSPSSSINVDDFTITYSCQTGAIDPGTTPKTTWKTDELSALTTELGAGYEIPYIGYDQYSFGEAKEDDEGYIINWHFATQEMFDTYKTTLTTAGYSLAKEINGSFAYQKVIADKTYDSALATISFDSEKSLITINTYKGGKIFNTNQWPSEAISSFFNDGSQAFPTFTTASTDFTYQTDKNADKGYNKIGFSITGVTQTELNQLIAALKTAGFIDSHFDDNEYINETTKSQVKDTTFDEGLLIFTLTDTADISSTLPATKLNTFFTNYKVKGDDKAYSQTFAPYQAASSNVRFQIETHTRTFTARVNVYASSISEMNTFINDMSTSTYGLMVYPNGSYDGTIVALNLSNYFRGDFTTYSNSGNEPLMRLEFSLDAVSQTHLKKCDSWSAVLNELVLKKTIDSASDFLAFSKDGFTYYYDDKSDNIVIKGVNQKDYDTYVASLVDTEGTYKGLYNPMNNMYESTVLHSRDNGTTYYVGISPDVNYISNGTISFNFAPLGIKISQSKAWETARIDECFRTTEVTSASSLIPSLTNEDNSRTFTYYGQTANDEIWIIVKGDADTDVANYTSSLTSSDYGYKFNDDFNIYMNQTKHMGVDFQYPEDTSYFVIHVQYSLSFCTPSTSWPDAAFFGTTYCDASIAHELAKQSFAIEGKSMNYYNYVGGTIEGSNRTIFSTIDCFLLGSTYTQEDLENYRQEYENQLTGDGYVLVKKDDKYTYTKVMTVTEDGVEKKYDVSILPGCDVVFKADNSTRGLHFVFALSSCIHKDE